MNSLVEVVCAIVSHTPGAVADQLRLAFEDVRELCAEPGLNLSPVGLATTGSAELARSFTPLFCILGDAPDESAGGDASSRELICDMKDLHARAPGAYRVYVYALQDDRSADGNMDEGRARFLKCLSPKQCFVRNCTVSRLRATMRADLADALELFRKQSERGRVNVAVSDLHESAAAAYRECYLHIPGSFETLDELVRDTTAPVVITGSHHIGKSALLANWILHVRRALPEITILQHFIEVDGDEATHGGLLRHLLDELCDRRLCAAPEGRTPAALEDAFNAWACSPSRARVLVVIDGLDQLDEPGRGLRWLPLRLGENVTIVTSAASGDRGDSLIAAVRERGWPEFRFSVPAELQSAVTRLIVRGGGWVQGMPMEYPRRENSGAVVVESGVMPGEEDGVQLTGTYIDEQADLVGQMTADTPRSWIRYMLGALSAQAFEAVCLISASRRGLQETDLEDLLDSVSDIPKLLADIGHLTVRRGGMIRPNNALVREETVRWISRRGIDLSALHTRLARHFADSKDTARRVHETPWQWKRSGNMEVLRSCIADLEMFNAIVEHGCEHELLGYWKDVGTYREAGTAYTRQIDYLFAGLDDPPPGLDIVTTLERLGAFLGSCGVYDTAERFLAQAIGKRKERLRGIGASAGGDHGTRAIIRAHGELGEMQRKAGRYEPAIENLRYAYEALKAEPDADAMSLAQVANDFGLALHESGRHVEGYEPLALIQEALATKERLFGPDHPALAETLSDLALLYQRPETAALAGAYCERALGNLGCERYGSVYDDEIGGTVLLSDSEGAVGATLDAATILANLAGARLKMKHRATALVLYHRVLEIREFLLRSEHPYVLAARSNVAAALMIHHDLANAEIICREGIADGMKAINEDHPLVLVAVNNLANVLRNLARRLKRQPDEEASARADALLGEALDLLAGAFGACERQELQAGHPVRCVCMDNLASTLALLGRHERAVTWFERAIGELRTGLGPHDTRIAAALYRWALPLRRLGRDPEAHDRLEEAWSMYGSVVDQTSADILYDLAIVRDDLDRDDACATLLQFLAESHLASEHPKVLDVRERIRRRGCGEAGEER
jgi:tetratricopeptide (TPR) repeat protein